MSELNMVLGFVQSCARGSLGFSECSPVFMIGGITLAVVILVITLAVLMAGHAKTQSSES